MISGGASMRSTAGPPRGAAAAHAFAFDAVFDGQPVLLVRSWAEVCVGNATNASLLDGALRRFHSVGAQLDPRRWLGWCERRRSR